LATSLTARPGRGRRPAASPPKTLTFPSRDGLSITTDHYRARSPRGFIVLCHRSHFNRGEYEEIAPQLVARGFSCLAIDQRSGMTVLGYTNETKGAHGARCLWSKTEGHATYWAALEKFLA
jgi:alpha-beta hydrolase superfamily lysophospholipase